LTNETVQPFGTVVEIPCRRVWMTPPDGSALDARDFNEAAVETVWRNSFNDELPDIWMGRIDQHRIAPLDDRAGHMAGRKKTGV